MERYKLEVLLLYVNEEASVTKHSASPKPVRAQ